MMNLENSELDLISQKLLDNEKDIEAWTELAKYILRTSSEASFNRGDLPDPILRLLHLPAICAEYVDDSNEDLNLAFVCYVNALLNINAPPSSMLQEIVNLICENGGSFWFEETFANDFPSFGCDFYSFGVYCAAHAIKRDPDLLSCWQSLNRILDTFESTNTDVRICKNILSKIIDFSIIDNVDDLKDYVTIKLLKLNVDNLPAIEFTIIKPYNLNRYCDPLMLSNLPSVYRHDTVTINCKLWLDKLNQQSDNKLVLWKNLLEYFSHTRVSYVMPSEIIPVEYRAAFGDSHNSQLQEICMQILYREPENYLAITQLEMICAFKFPLTERVKHFFSAQGLDNVEDNIRLSWLLAKISKIVSSANKYTLIYEWLDVLKFIWKYPQVYIPFDKMPDIYRDKASVALEFQPFLHLSRVLPLATTKPLLVKVLYWYYCFFKRSTNNNIKAIEAIDFILNDPKLQRYRKTWNNLSKPNQMNSLDIGILQTMFEIFILLEVINLGSTKSKVFCEMIKALERYKNLRETDNFIDFDDEAETMFTVHAEVSPEWSGTFTKLIKKIIPSRNLPENFNKLSIPCMQIYFYSEMKVEHIDKTHLINCTNSSEMDGDDFIPKCLATILHSLDKSKIDDFLLSLRDENKKIAIMTKYLGENKEEVAREYLNQLNRYQRIKSKYGLSTLKQAKTWCNNRDIRNWVFYCLSYVRNQLPPDALALIAIHLIKEEICHTDLKQLTNRAHLVCFGVNSMQTRFHRQFDPPKSLIESDDDANWIAEYNGVLDKVDRFLKEVECCENFVEIENLVKKEIAAVLQAKHEAQKDFEDFTEEELAQYANILEKESQRLKKF